MYIMGRVPQITFVKDKHAARLAEVERLLKLADMGPEPEPTDEQEDNLLGSDSETELSDTEGRFDKDLSETDYYNPKTNVLGLDHAALMQSVIISKNKSKDRSFQACQVEESNTGPFNLEGVSQFRSDKTIQEKLPSRKLSRRVVNRSRYEEDVSLYNEKYQDTFDEEDVYHHDDYDKI
jgi:hypothetical protein